MLRQRGLVAFVPDEVSGNDPFAVGLRGRENQFIRRRTFLEAGLVAEQHALGIAPRTQFLGPELTRNHGAAPLIDHVLLPNPRPSRHQEGRPIPRLHVTALVVKIEPFGNSSMSLMQPLRRNSRSNDHYMRGIARGIDALRWRYREYRRGSGCDDHLSGLRRRRDRRLRR